MYTATHILTSLSDPTDVELILKDENDQELRMAPNLGNLIKVADDQIYTLKGEKVILDDDIATIDEPIVSLHAIIGDKDIFYATRKNGEKTIVETKTVLTTPMDKLNDLFAKKERQTFIRPFRKGLSIQPLDISGTFLEKWITERLYISKGHWVLLIDHHDNKCTYEIYNPVVQKKIGYCDYICRSDVLERRRPLHSGGWGERGESVNFLFASPPEFFEDEVRGLCMRALIHGLFSDYYITVDEKLMWSEKIKHSDTLRMYQKIARET